MSFVLDAIRSRSWAYDELPSMIYFLRLLRSNCTKSNSVTFFPLEQRLVKNQKRKEKGETNEQGNVVSRVVPTPHQMSRMQLMLSPTNQP